jgi:Rhodanese-related sulfurtransferase
MAIYTTIINPQILSAHLQDAAFRIADCRFDLPEKKAGFNAYLAAHIPGAVYADLDTDLSGPPVTDHGRHPLPAPEFLRDVFARLGIRNDTQVVVYDHSFGSIAGRLWWLLRYMGHSAVAVLDGGWQEWEKAGLPTRSGEEQCASGHFRGEARKEWLVTADMVPQFRLLIDSRDPARYRGETEPLDRRAGHIPGALNRFWKNNLDENGLFKSPGLLRREFSELLEGVDPRDAVVYCGSGVTACHNLLGAAHAGLEPPKLYAGSWSDWCSSPERPVATGEEKRWR